MTTFTNQQLQDIATAHNVPSSAVLITNPITGDIYWVNPRAKQTIQDIIVNKFSRNFFGQLPSVYWSVAGDATPPAPSPVPVPNPSPTPSPSPNPSPTPLPSPNPSPTPTPSPGVVDLASALQVSPGVLNKSYLKGSGIAVAPETIFLRNTSTQVDLIVGIRSINGVTFTPNTVTIPSSGQATVLVTIDYHVLENYPDGTSTIQAIFDVSSPNGIIYTPPVTTTPVTTPVGKTCADTIYEVRTDLPPTVDQVGYLTYNTPTWRIVKYHQFTDCSQQIISSVDYLGSRVLVKDDTPLVTQSFWLSGATGQQIPGTPPPQWVQDPQTRAWWDPNSPEGRRLLGITNTPVTTVTWVDGTTGTLHQGSPPSSGWIYDPNGGDWYPINSPFGQKLAGIPSVPTTPPPAQQPPTTSVWVDGTTGTLHQGSPPSGWLYDPNGGEWYPPNSPFGQKLAGTTPPPLATPQPPLSNPIVPTPVTPPVQPSSGGGGGGGGGIAGAPLAPSFWVDGLTGALNQGSPPSGFVLDPNGGAWYPATSAFGQKILKSP